MHDFWIANPHNEIFTTLAQQLALKGGADQDYSDSVILAFFLAPDDLPPVTVKGPADCSLLPPTTYHVTLATLDSATRLEARGVRPTDIVEKLRTFCLGAGPLDGWINGWGRFDGEGSDAVYLNFDSPALPHFREALAEQVADFTPPTAAHGFTPHLTIGYVPKGQPVTMVTMPSAIKLHFTSLVLAWRGEQYTIPLLAPSAKGGPGSGFHDHAGRPGERGGSAPSGQRPAYKLPPNDGKYMDIHRQLEGKTQERWQDNAILKDMLTTYSPHDELTDEVLADIAKQTTTGFYLDKQAPRLKEQVVWDLHNKAGLTMEEANAFVKQWAHSSNDHDMRSLGIQEVAAEVFGVPLTPWQEDRLGEVSRTVNDLLTKLVYENKESTFADDKVRHALYAIALDMDRDLHSDSALYLFQAKEIEKIADAIGEGTVPVRNLYDASLFLDQAATAAKTKIRKAVEVMYQTTQARLKELGVTEVRAYRGAVLEEDFESDTVRQFQTSPLTSWSLDATVARDFAQPSLYQTGVLMETIIPAERIFSYPITGNGCLSEFEVVAVGGTDKARIRHVIAG